MHGNGKITTPEGKDIEGIWVNGEYTLPPAQNALPSSHPDINHSQNIHQS